MKQIEEDSPNRNGSGWAAASAPLTGRKPSAVRAPVATIVVIVVIEVRLCAFKTSYQMADALQKELSRSRDSIRLTRRCRGQCLNGHHYNRGCGEDL